jgi:hypothetical protein
MGVEPQKDPSRLATNLDSLEITELRFSHDECTHLVDARAFGQLYIEAFPARAFIDGAKDVTFPSCEKFSGFGWMGDKNGRMPAGWAREATLNSLPSLHTRATIEIRFGIHIAMRTHGRTGGGDNDIVYVSRIHRDTPQILVPQAFL